MRRAKQLGIKIGIDDNMESLRTYREQKYSRIGNFTNLLKDSIHIPLKQESSKEPFKSDSYQD